LFPNKEYGINLLEIDELKSYELLNDQKSLFHIILNLTPLDKI